MSLPDTAATLLGLAPLFGLDFAVTRDDDWHDPLPQFLIGGAPFSIAGMSVDLYVRPAFDHITTMLHLTNVNAGSDGVIFDDASTGLMTVHVQRATVQANLPAGLWRQFAVLSDPARQYGWAKREIWRGALLVLPGLTT